MANLTNALKGVYTLAVPAVLGASLFQASIYDVKGGTRAVIFDRYSGVKDTVVNEGTHFLIPWLQKSIIYDVRTKPRNISTTTGSKDLQMVSLTLRVLHRPEVQNLPKIYQVRSLNPPFQSQKQYQAQNLIDDRILAKTMTKESSPPLATRSSSPSLPSSMPPN
jgi:regulator of protease activity HflC (stomatin/prohibitin superfamily)